MAWLSEFKRMEGPFNLFYQRHALYTSLELILISSALLVDWKTIHPTNSSSNHFFWYCTFTRAKQLLPTNPEDHGRRVVVVSGAAFGGYIPCPVIRFTSGFRIACQNTRTTARRPQQRLMLCDSEWWLHEIKWLWVDTITLRLSEHV